MMFSLVVWLSFFLPMAINILTINVNFDKICARPRRPTAATFGPTPDFAETTWEAAVAAYLCIPFRPCNIYPHAQLFLEHDMHRSPQIQYLQLSRTQFPALSSQLHMRPPHNLLGRKCKKKLKHPACIRAYVHTCISRSKFQAIVPGKLTYASMHARWRASSTTRIAGTPQLLAGTKSRRLDKDHSSVILDLSQS